MLTTLDAIVERIITGYDPDRIILFGSSAAGSVRDGSDIDLLIVKETDRRPLERSLEIEMLLSDRSVPLDLLVFTPLEIRRLYSAGSPLMEEIVENGRILYMRKATQTWINEATDEVQSARILLDHGKYRGACLHSQQGVEKALKALTVEKGKRPARTHDIVDLLQKAIADEWAVNLPIDDAVYLNSVYRDRYPTEEGLLPHGEPAEEESRHAVDIAEKLVSQIKSLVP
jgi:HEPN domain-containing protein/predicted nucleotidyltransferase